MTTTAFTGSWVHAPNLSADSVGSIHDEEQAKRVGFEAALVGGSVLLAFMTPVLTEIFGPAWYERGFLKQSFVSPIYESTEFRTYAEDLQPQDGDERLVAFGLEKREGVKATLGYAGIRRDAASAISPWLRAGEPPLAPAMDPDPLPGQAVGAAAEPVTLLATPDLPANSMRRRAAAEMSEWYETKSPWGGPVVPTFMYILAGSMRDRSSGDTGPAQRAGNVGAGVTAGMNGTFQLLLTGPMFCGRPYIMNSRLVEKGVSGRTAFRTNEFSIEDGNGRRVAIARQKVRWFQQPAG